ncbi:hypothetical protein BKA56DRAFT_477055 [Ilyonectria sp. MPI-CAGE-AT-0026]|nr:hypothetical protein BKA56DRAFT_477055 [Ilyonectria sp. MPI-CAGE-AT-0026]
MSQHDVKALASLETIPLEIQQLIFEFLCPHCCSNSPFDFSQASYHRDFNSLALTSKSLRPLAQPFLVHRPHEYLGMADLFHLLDTQGQLGAHVKEVELNFEKPKPEELKFFKQIARKLLVAAGNDPDLEENNLEGLITETFDTELLMVLAPELEALRVEIWDWEDSTWENWPQTDLKYLSERLKKPGHSPGFESVRYLEFERPCRCVTNLSSPTIPTLLSATPNLRHLKLIQIIGNPSRHTFDFNNIQPALQSLTTIELSYCTFDGELETSDFGLLRQMLQSALALKCFKFIAGRSAGAPSFVDHDVPPSAFIAALRPRRAHLRHLQLDFSDFPYFESIEKSELSQFSLLETLELSIDCFETCRLEVDETIEHPDNLCLSTMIPLTVKRLSINQGYCGMDFTSGIQHLIKKYVAGGFPALEVLEIESMNGLPGSDETDVSAFDSFLGPLEIISQLLKGSSVSLRFKGPIYAAVKRAIGDKLSWMNVDDMHQD